MMHSQFSNRVFSVFSSAIVICLSFVCTALAQDSTLTYFQSGAQIGEFVSGSQAQNSSIIIWGERFTLNSSNGAVDSVDFVLDSVVSPNIEILLYPDTLTQSTSGMVHLPNILAQVAPYTTLNIASSKITAKKRFTIAVPHVAVPKEFFLLVDSYVGSAGVPLPDQIPGSIESAAPYTSENTRGVCIGARSNSVGVAFPINGNFLNKNGVPISADFDFGVTVKTTEGVEHINPSQHQLVTTPDPVTSRTPVEIQDTKFAEAKYSVFDGAGRVVLEAPTWQTVSNRQVQIPTTDLPNGAYTIILKSKYGETEKARVLIHR